MYVRLAFSVAAHLEPEILLVDEVLAVGDASFQRKCLGKMGDVARSGRTVLFVSHNMEAVSTLCDRGVLLSRGRVIEDGPTNQVIETYLGSIRSSEGANDAIVEPEIKPDLDAQIHRVRLLDSEDRPGNVTDLMNGVVLEIEFEVRRPFDNLVVAFQIKRSDGFLVFSSGDLDSVNIDSEALQDQSPKAEGRYRARVDLPAPLLNTGVYEVETVLTTPRVAVIDSVSGLLFEVVDASGGSFASCVFKSRREGLLAVPLRWKIEQTGSADGDQRPDS
jgi:lipopolysaccharide transport system ATP-binding protein